MTTNAEYSDHTADMTNHPSHEATPTSQKKPQFIRYFLLVPGGLLLVFIGVVIGIFISPYFVHSLSTPVLISPQGETQPDNLVQPDPNVTPFPDNVYFPRGLNTNSEEITPQVEPANSSLADKQGGITPPLPESCHPRHVVLVSIDALRADAVTTHHALPVIGELAQNGAYDWQADTIKPSITNPGHASMLTGLSVEHHGVKTNAAADYPYPFLQAKSIFNYLKEQDPQALNIVVVGKKRMVIFNQPDVVDQFYPFTKSQPVTEAAVKAIQAYDFRMIFIHLPDPDSAGHNYSFESEQYVNTVRKQDALLQQILDALIQKGIYSSTLLIIGSDHAGEGTGHGDYKDLDRWYPFVMTGPCVKNGYDIHSNGRQVNIMDITPTILYSLGIPIPGELDGTPLYEAFLNEE
jgi:hypothetical protein